LKKRDQLIADGRTFVSIDETSFGRHGADVRVYAKATVSSLAAVDVGEEVLATMKKQSDCVRSDRSD
jgi:hypothetical protein